MKYQESEISLSVIIAGELASRGKYEARQKVDEKGNKMYEMWKNPYDGTFERLPVIQLRTTQLQTQKDCTHCTKLNNSFVQWALSDDSRPKDVSAGYWNKMNEKNRIHFHVRKYVQEMFGDVKFSYTILE